MAFYWDWDTLNYNNVHSLMNHKEVNLSGENILLLSIEWNTLNYNNFHSSMNHKEVNLSVKIFLTFY